MRALVLLPLVLGSGLAAAGAPDRAEDHIKLGLELRRKGEPEMALAEFQKAHALEPSGRTFAQMGIAEAALERWLDAEAHLSTALAEQSAWIQKNHPPLDAVLDTARSHIGELDVLGPAGALLIVDGERVGTTPLAKPLRRQVGQAKVEVMAVGFEPFAQTVAIASRGKTVVLAELQAVPARPAPATLRAPSRDPEPRTRGTPPSSGRAAHDRTSSRLAGAAILGTGLAIAGVGASLVWLDGQASCTGPSCVEVYDTRGLGWAAVTVGAVIGIGGGWLLYRSSSGEATLVAAPGAVALAGRF